MKAKILPESMKFADDGYVTCSVQGGDNQVHMGVIENSFFEDFFGHDRATQAEKLRAAKENISYSR